MSRDARGMGGSSGLDSARVTGVPGVTGVGGGSSGVSCPDIASRSSTKKGGRIADIVEVGVENRRTRVVGGRKGREVRGDVK